MSISCGCSNQPLNQYYAAQGGGAQIVQQPQQVVYYAQPQAAAPATAASPYIAQPGVPSGSTQAAVAASAPAVQAQAVQAPAANTAQAGTTAAAAVPGAAAPTSAAPAASGGGATSSSAAVAGASGDAVAPTSGSTVANQTPGWNESWEKVFVALGIPENEISALRGAGFSGDRLLQIATELMKQPGATPAEPSAPVNNTPASTGGGPQGTTPNAPAASTSGAGTGSSAAPDWSKWSGKFRELFVSMGASKAETDAQLKAIQGKKYDEQGLKALYEQIKAISKEPAAGNTPTQGSTPGAPTGGADAGAWNKSWEIKFRAAFAKAKVPIKQMQEIMTRLSTSGMSQTDLQKFYDQNAPAWDDKWKKKFEDLGLPPEALKQIQEGNLPKSELQKQFDNFNKTKKDYEKDGLYKKLKDKLKPDQLWGYMMQNPKPSKKGVEKTLEAMHAASVPMWKRVANMAIDFIPGVSTLEFALGRQLITGDKVDRTNPFNIGMAIISALPAVSWAKGAVQAWKGANTIATAANTVKTANAAANAMKGMSTAANVANTTGKIAQGTAALGGGVAAAKGASIVSNLARAEQIVASAGGLEKAAKFGSFFQKAKMITPLVNRFGQAKNMYNVSRSAYNISKFTATFDAIKSASPTVQNALKDTKILNETKNAEQLLERADQLRKGAAHASSTNANKNIAETALRQADRLEAQAKTIGEFEKVAGMTPRQYNVLGNELDAVRSGQVGMKFEKARVALDPTKSHAGVTFKGATASGDSVVAKAGTSVKSKIANVVQKPFKKFVDQRDIINIGRTVNPGGKASFDQFASQLLAHAGEGDATRLMAKLGTSQATGVHRSLARLPRMLFSPGSDEAVLKAVGQVAHPGTGYQALTAASRYARFAAGGTISMMAGFPILTGTKGKEYEDKWDRMRHPDAYRQWEESVAPTPEDLAPLTGIEDRGTGSATDDFAGNPTGNGTPQLEVDPQTGWPIDPDWKLPFNPETGVIYDPASGKSFNPVTREEIDPNTLQPISAAPNGGGVPTSDTGMTPGYEDPEYTGGDPMAGSIDPMSSTAAVDGALESVGALDSSAAANTPVPGSNYQYQQPAVDPLSLDPGVSPYVSEYAQP